MKEIEIDEEKLPEVMKLIDKAATLMETENGEANQEIQNELSELQSKLREITCNKNIKIDEYRAYWSYTDLETVARMALQSPPEKQNLTNEQIKELINKIANAEFDEATNDYYLKVLEIETGLDNVVDYIYYPDEIGLKQDASMEEIIEKIIADRK